MKRKLVFLIILIAFSLLPALTLADNHTTASGSTTEYKLLAPLPYVDPDGDRMAEAGPYIEGAVKLTIIVSGVLAVIMIMYGGIKYMSTDAFSGKSEAKGVIQNALWGLALVLGSWMILYTINPKLVNLDLSIERFIPQESSNTVDVTDPEDPEDPGEGDGGGGDDGDLPMPTRAWRLVPANAPNPGGKCIDDRINNGTRGEYTKNGERHPRCPDNTPTMVDLRVVVPEAGRRCVDSGPCKIHANGVPGMRRFVENARRIGLEWKIIDAYPPTNDHLNICHQNGGCVDIQSDPISIDGFIKLCRAARASRLDYLNESGHPFERDSGIRATCVYGNILNEDSHRYAQLHVFF